MRWSKSEYRRRMEQAPTREALHALVESYLQQLGATLHSGESYADVAARLNAKIEGLGTVHRYGDELLAYAEARWWELEDQETP